MNANRRNQRTGGTGGSSLSLGSFFGTYGSPIQTQMERMQIKDKPSGQNKKKQHNGSKFSAPSDSDGSDEANEAGGNNDIDTELMEAETKRGNNGRKRMGRRAQGDKPEPTAKLNQMRLDVARKANIPLFSKSPLFQVQPDIKVLPSRQTHNQNIDFKEVTLGKCIGEGAFGKVHEGKWQNRPVAIKLLICQELNQDILEEFQSEVQIMSVLRHPNICRLLGACIDPPNRALVVELLSKGSLWGVLRTTRDIDDDLRIKFISHTAKGMSYLHQFQPPICHRDLKSPNLLVDRDYNIKISDFGLARVKAHVQTMTGNCGTVQWMAPEVLGNQKYTEKADVFSFGIVVWEIVTGKCPYEGMTQIQAALGVLNRKLRPVVPTSCPRFLSQLMKACWASDPENRPSFQEVVHALREYTNATNAYARRA